MEPCGTAPRRGQGVGHREAAVVVAVPVDARARRADLFEGLPARSGRSPGRSSASPARRCRRRTPGWRRRGPPPKELRRRPPGGAGAVLGDERHRRAVLDRQAPPLRRFAARGRVDQPSTWRRIGEQATNTAISIGYPDPVHDVQDCPDVGRAGPGRAVRPDRQPRGHDLAAQARGVLGCYGSRTGSPTSAEVIPSGGEVQECTPHPRATGGAPTGSASRRGASRRRARVSRWPARPEARGGPSRGRASRVLPVARRPLYGSVLEDSPFRHERLIRSRWRRSARTARRRS